MTTTREPSPTFIRAETPYWQYGCGCKASAVNLERCRLHREAPAMLEALTLILARYDELRGGRTNAAIQFQREVDPVRALLARLEKEITR